MSPRRLDIVVAAYTRTILDNESQQRTMLRLSLEADPEERSQLPLRQGRVIKWLEEALAPLQPQLPRSEVHRLAIAIRSATGIEALSWLTDVAGLSREDAAALMRWSAHAMLDATTADPIRNREEEAAWSTRRRAIAVSEAAWRRVDRALLGDPCLEQVPDRETERR